MGERDENQIFTIVEENAAPIGGMSAFYKYVGEKWSTHRRHAGCKLKAACFASLWWTEMARFKMLRVIRGIGAGCDEEAIRVIQSTPWKPGKQRGKPVRSKFNLAIIFKLN